MIDVARNGRLHHSRFRLSTFCTMRQLSAYDGAVSSVAMTASLAPIACRSHPPRTGSPQAGGHEREDHGRERRRPGTAPASRRRNASSPAASGPTNAPTALAARCVLKTLLRDSIG